MYIGQKYIRDTQVTLTSSEFNTKYLNMMVCTNGNILKFSLQARDL